MLEDVAKRQQWIYETLHFLFYAFIFVHIIVWYKPPYQPILLHIVSVTKLCMTAKNAGHDITPLRKMSGMIIGHTVFDHAKCSDIEIANSCKILRHSKDNRIWEKSIFIFWQKINDVFLTKTLILKTAWTEKYLAM